MFISLVAAASENNVIGKDNALPWHLPADLRFFKKMTLGKPVIMGRKTFESLGKALPGRTNVVLSRKETAFPEGILRYDALDEALRNLDAAQTPECCIIGGGQVFHESIGIADRIYLTRVHTVIADGTAFFPDINLREWQLVWEEAHTKDERHAYNFTFQEWQRIP